MLILRLSCAIMNDNFLACQTASEYVNLCVWVWYCMGVTKTALGLLRLAKQWPSCTIFSPISPPELLLVYSIQMLWLHSPFTAAALACCSISCFWSWGMLFQGSREEWARSRRLRLPWLKSNTNGHSSLCLHQTCYYSKSPLADTNHFSKI